MERLIQPKAGYRPFTIFLVCLITDQNIYRITDQKHTRKNEEGHQKHDDPSLH